MTNAALFTTVAREYADFRPGYPPELFAWLASVAPRHDAVWDCGCGSGQASVSLAGHFTKVHATDVAAEQIAAAKPHPRVSYSVAPAENSGLTGGSVDLVTVAQALHWFDVDAFYAEARRVMKPGAVLAVWNYPRPRFVDPAFDARFLAFYTDVVGSYWPPERRHIESNYSTLPPFPAALGFEPLPAPDFALALEWTAAQVLGYVSSWSATARYKKANGTDPVPLLQAALAEIWTDSAPRPIRMPLGLKAARLR
ncbi:MAG TPA: class I SAM-dependent methyltransferase [Steroidobacteraceae bacterium]|nr:class I SAM-dependent methyltransferase [Steroidobacteraceae bacterium]